MYTTSAAANACSEIVAAVEYRSVPASRSTLSTAIAGGAATIGRRATTARTRARFTPESVRDGAPERGAHRCARSPPRIHRHGSPPVPAHGRGRVALAQLRPRLLAQRLRRAGDRGSRSLRLA